MTALPIEHDTLPPVPHTLAGIRNLLTDTRQAEFDAEWASADLDDLTAIGKLRDRWWCIAAVESHPGLMEELAAAADGEFFPSPFAR